MDISLTSTNVLPYRERRPEGYTDVGGYTDLGGSGRWLCDRCGSNVGRTDLHDAFHDRVEPPPSAPAKQPQIHEWTEDQ
jgi:hypothetical protein